jgi:hypothetical protein
MGSSAPWLMNSLLVGLIFRSRPLPRPAPATANTPDRPRTDGARLSRRPAVSACELAVVTSRRAVGHDQYANHHLPH